MVQQSRDNPDPKNIIPDDQKRKRNATDRAQGVDSYFNAVEATTKPRQVQVTKPHPPSLKIRIPKDASKPDGDAVENGILLSATELQRRGHFVNSPSDAVALPIPSEKTRNKSEDGDSTKDKTYQPPKRSNPLDDEAPQSIYTTEGEEITSETEYGRALREKRQKRKRKATSDKPPKCAKKKRAVVDSNSDDQMDIDSGAESDGKNALREVEEREGPKAARRGPGNASMLHFYDPTAIVDRSGQMRWEFRCRFCTWSKGKAYIKLNSTRSFRRTVDGEDITFDAEPKLPKLQNLAGHVIECKGAKTNTSMAGVEPTSQEEMKLKQSVNMMEAYLKEGELNPEIVATYKGFLRIFAAWIFDESLPWTTGEAPTLQMLFKYLKVTYPLPSDTTVRNQLAHIFAELHGKVVREFSAIKSKIAYATDTWTTPQMVYTFSCTIGCFIDEDWEIIERVVDFKPLEDKEHQGLYGGKAFTDGASKIGSLHKIINDVLIATVARILLAKYGIPESTTLQIRCTCHVVNLVVQDILAALGEADDPDDVDYYSLNKEQPIHLDIDADSDQVALDNEEFEDEVEDEAADSENITMEEEEKLTATASPLSKLRFITNKIASTPQRRKKFRRCAIAKYFKKNSDPDRRQSLAVVRDVRTRWNYTHAMIRRAELLQEAIDDWVFKTPGLRALFISKF